MVALPCAGVMAAGCGGDDVRPRTWYGVSAGVSSTAASTATAVASARRDTTESTGEIGGDSGVVPVSGIWITDANVLALAGLMASRQTAAANAEIEGWHVDAVRALATATIRENVALRHSIDSVAALTRLAPVMPALGTPLSARLQSGIDSMMANRGEAFDRAFVRQQIASHQIMAQYVRQLSAVSEHPEVKGLLAATAAQVRTRLDRARAVQATLAAADSVAAADSAARAERRNRRSGVP